MNEFLTGVSNQNQNPYMFMRSQYGLQNGGNPNILNPNQQASYPQQMMPMQNMQVPQTQTMPAINQYSWVNGYAGAQAFPTQPNTQIILFDSDEDFYYVKITDAQGRANITRYRFEEVLDNEPKKRGRKPTSSSVDMTDFVSRNEFDEFKKQLIENLGPLKGTENSQE